MDTTQRLKYEIREYYRDVRRNIIDCNHAAELLINAFNQILNYIQGKIVAAYVPIDGEINVIPLMHHLLNLGYTIAIPDQNRLLEFKEWNKVDKTIIVPDTIIVPIVAFDNCCNRLGFGSGWYDRVIEKLSKLFIGVAYEAQFSRYIPTETHDKQLDIIITEKCFRVCTKKIK
ncbi:5-formyltetrahydrofolate cyclo-ligase [Wolbachia pipientis]|uniref:5-formyltetrahydrofolate cyclo-ligase n=1 Tax=Wolbachia pipientis TaxID=955 RepID=A0A1E7QKW6_WOLPI|nr:5-formyltetrahydrofolate cyclo-ligase [Wolbachia pipientis]OEY87121.1 5-formyltetrahydrofolate cyclo-ligase [Wolbachia pipientis]